MASKYVYIAKLYDSISKEVARSPEDWKAFLETDEHELITLYKEKSLVVGQQVSFVENQIEFKGRAIAVTDTGNLVIQLENGKAKTISSGEISLTSWTASPPVE